MLKDTSLVRFLLRSDEYFLSNLANSLTDSQKDKQTERQTGEQTSGKTTSLAAIMSDYKIRKCYCHCQTQWSHTTM